MRSSFSALKALELDSTFTLAYAHLCNAYVGKKMYAEAAKAERLRSTDTTRSYRLAIVYSQMGLKEKARSMLTAWQQSIQEETQYTSLAIVSAG